MRKIKIVADSSCDLQLTVRENFSCAPMKIVTSNCEFVDDAALDTEKMAEYFDHYKGTSRSSCPNANDWLDAFGDADEIFCVTITSGLSGSYNSACAAKQIYESEHRGGRVCVIDSLSAGPENLLIVEKLEQYVRAELPFEEICVRISDDMKRTGLFFMLKSLKNFANNGRISPIVAKIVGVAGICIVGKASDEGTLEPLRKCRGEARSLCAIAELLEEGAQDYVRISIGHCQNEAAALSLEKMIKERFPDARTYVHKLGGLCSFYAETGGILLGFEKA